MRLKKMAVAVGAIVCAVVISVVVPAAADPPSTQWYGQFAVDQPGTGSSGPSAVCTHMGATIDCTAGTGRWWYQSRQCYGSVYDGQPAVNQPAGYDNPTGDQNALVQPDWVLIVCSIYECYFPPLVNPPDPTPLTPTYGHDPNHTKTYCDYHPQYFYDVENPLSPRALARRAVADMHLQAPQLGLTGHTDDPRSMQVLGLPTWMWAADPGDSTTGPITRYESAGDLTVTATGHLTSTVWSMGDGGSVTCNGPDAAGTVYAASYGADPSPTCGYVYGWTSAGQPGGAFTVSVTANWTVDWEGGGQSGQITVSMARTAQLRVGEVQVITEGKG